MAILPGPGVNVATSMVNRIFSRCLGITDDSSKDAYVSIDLVGSAGNLLMNMLGNNGGKNRR